jgi:hypothetical protein
VHSASTMTQMGRRGGWSTALAHAPPLREGVPFGRITMHTETGGERIGRSSH